MSNSINKSKRIKEIDMLRGFALFGVLLVNVFGFKSTLFAQGTDFAFFSFPLAFQAGLDQVLGFLIRILAEAKFYPIFSFLFGFGFYIFMNNAFEKKAALSGNKPGRLFRRRCFFLLLFGLLNLILVWYGDILHVYGVTGLILLLFYNQKTESLKKWIIALLIFAVLLMTGMIFIAELAQTYASEMNDPKLESFPQELMEYSFAVYSEGSYLDVISFRISQELPYVFFNLFIWLPKILALFLIGLYAAKQGYFHDIANNIDLFKRTWKVTGFLGLISTILMLLSAYSIISANSLISAPLEVLFSELASIFISLFYIATVIILIHKGYFHKLFDYLTYVGRMALTNYLIQCILCSIVFYGYGLGYIGSISVYQGVIFTIVFFSIQMLVSKFWLRNFRYGPFEKVWRNLTYKSSI
ncbi:DUF418 domain-containing protein [Natranaerobius thermophilus]|uniref:DUF418 domain-containing protein n=1 Tax=Natranaerobius thermophilus (strain ATCC BAA-1301 / DSM 18059 / JW/NM-WN-LF) TaxID=457570 RepID=B2A7H3_NATTJ|nr:DUF418 domain-containing protein [Natranaerobius thermophilus]ACB85682.1 protein of unknown function DUF418 [Natranaerobius thermophilus JW/NM-WN-LF]